ncbi:MAG: hypothetical protein PSV23_05625 [Brevundimonas sp.]|uniref:hypothetical protein n=1 Tax=Brevundimonas sp. TaxID=1871086 RepID=UPI00248843DD|nr:hypothetical protein [Brevundimonas sp.]MDI1326263.1 hypothetical protein [Brevundimonas sp.]
MARFSIGTAIGDAFGLIRRRPLSVFVWGLLMVAPSAATLGLMLPMMGDMVGEMAAAGPDGGAHNAAFADMMQFQALSWLMNLVQLFLTVVVYTAVMRAVLRPRESGFFSLRLGMDEVRVAVVGIAVVVGIYIAMIVLTLIGFAVGFAVWGAGSPMNWLVITGLIVTVILVVWLAMARVSLIAPASVLYRSFAFPEGWRLARGQTGALFGMMLLVVLLVIVIEAVVFGVGLAVAVAAGLSDGVDWTTLHAHNMDVNPFEGLGAVFAANWPWFAAAAVVVSMVYGLALTLSIAPFASACRQLAGSETPPVADAQSPASAG